MACRVKIQPTASKELEGIVAYLPSFGPNTAASFLNEWENALERLREESVIHRLSRFDILARLGYYAILIKGYIALYFIEGGDVVIAHLFHQSQDYANIVLNGI